MQPNSRGEPPDYGETVCRIEKSGSINLFDLSFSSFVTPQLLKLLYGLVVFGGALLVLCGIVYVWLLPDLNTVLKIVSSVSIPYRPLVTDYMSTIMAALHSAVSTIVEPIVSSVTPLFHRYNFWCSHNST